MAKELDIICINCGISKKIPNKYSKGPHIFCGHDCQQKYHRKNRLNRWFRGEIDFPGKKSLKHYLLEKQEFGCVICKITEWNGKHITLEIEHIDGNSYNNRPENLALICPNCHSQTETYKGRNKGNGRFKRKQRYQEGKSY